MGTRQLTDEEVQSMGLEEPQGERRIRQLTDDEVQQMGLEEPAAQEPQGFQLPYPKRGMEGLALDAKTGQPAGDLTGPVNPFRAASLGLQRGATMEWNDEAAAGIDSALGGDRQASLENARNAMAANEGGYPKITKAAKVIGAVGGLGKLGVVGGAVKGLSGVALRAASAMGLGGLMGATEAAGESNSEIDSPETIEAAKRGGTFGALAGGVAQLGIGEPLRAGAKWLQGAISGVDENVARSANEAIDSATGKAGKQQQEAVGGAVNLREADSAYQKMGAAAPASGPAAPAGPMGIPTNANLQNPAYIFQGQTPDQVRAFLQQRGASPSRIEQVLEQAGPYLKQGPAPVMAPTAVGRRGGAAAAPALNPAQAKLKELDQRFPGVERHLMDQRVRNAGDKIADARLNPVKIPTADEAVQGAQEGLDAAARGRAGQGMKRLALGAGGMAIGNPLGVGAYNLHRGVRDLAGAAFSSPAVMNRLRKVPGAAEAISAAAPRGAIALETALFSIAKNDPAAAQEFEAIGVELNGGRMDGADEE
jgi:hypothetical protein